MKRAAFVLLVVNVVFLGAGCATSGAALLAQKDPIALVSVVSNWDINWKDEDPINPNSAGFLIDKALRDDPDLTVVSYADELITTAETLFQNAIANSPLINLAEKKTVLSSRAYQEAKLNNIQINHKMVKPAEYRFVNYRDRNFPAAMINETGIQRSMFVEFNFTKSMVSGFGKNGNLRADIDMIITILDSKGKTIYRKMVSSWSGSSIRVASEVYSRTGLMELFEDAISEVCHEFLYQPGN